MAALELTSSDYRRVVREQLRIADDRRSGVLVEGLRPRSKATGLGAAASKLEYRTHHVQTTNDQLIQVDFTEPIEGLHWRLDLLDFGDGYHEATAVMLEKPRTKKKKKINNKKEKNKDEFRDDMSSENLARSVIRAKRNMRHKCFMMKADRLLTLTTRKSIADRSEFQSCMDRFRRLVKAHYGDKFCAIVVFEEHDSDKTSEGKRGAHHGHMALNRYYDINLLRSFWNKAVTGEGWYKGCGREMAANVQITSPRKGVFNRHKIASYLAKYMIKDMAKQKKNAKRFMSWGDIRKPKRKTFFVAPCYDPFYVIKKIIEHVTGKVFTRFFERSEGVIEMIWYSTSM